MTEKKYEIHLVSHTHHDREWYKTFEEYRLWLVKLVDKLLRILDSVPEYRYFTLDGQTIVLEDYLQVKPENEEQLRKYISQGRIFVGPWYVLPDEFLVSGESLIRNLMLGHKIALSFGKVMKVGYLPDPFGHISQIAQILRGFGINSIIFTRGMGEEGEKLGSIFRLKDHAGNSILGVWQVGHYSDSAALGYTNPDVHGNTKEPLNLEKALETVRRSKKLLSKYARTRYLLFNNGEDFYQPQPEIPVIIDYLNKHLKDAVVIHSNFEEFIKKVKSSNPQLATLEGELRASKYESLLSGVISSRIYLKQTNERAQTLLEKKTEPLTTLAWLEKMKYPKNVLWQSWKYLLQCHPHDSICGCGIDEVHRDVMRRFSWSQQIANVILEKSFDHLANRIDTTSPDSTFPSIIVFNTLNWKRTNLTRIKLFSKKGTRPSHFVITDNKGNRIPAQVCKTKEVAFLAENIPAYGYKVYSLVPATKKENWQSTLKVSKNVIENEYYRVEINKNGTLSIRDKISNLSYKNVLLFEDREDAGDEYNFSPAKISQRITTENSKAKITIEEAGPVFATLKIELDLNLPKALLKDRTRRSKRFVRCPLETYVTLYSGLKRIDFRTVFKNKVKDHRLRVLFPTDIKTDYSFAEGQFDVVKRKIKLPAVKNWREPPSPTHPQQSFVSISDGQKGLTLINRGLPEYEAIPTENGTTLALTLLRSVGWLSRNDLLTRKGNAGPKIPTPEAQCFGRHEFKYSLIPHPGNWETNKVWLEAYNHNVELISKTVNQHKGPLPKEFSFLKIQPETLVVSALKKAENSEALVLRIYNLESKIQKAEIRSYKKIKKADHLNLNEEPAKDKTLEFSENKISLPIRPFQIITIGIKF